MIKKSTYIFIIIIVISYISFKHTKQTEPVIESSTIQDVEPAEKKIEETSPPTYKINKDIEESLKPKEIISEEKNTSKEIKEEPKVQNKQEKQEKDNFKPNDNNITIKEENKPKEPEIIVEQPKLKGPHNIRTDFEQIHPNDFTNHAGGHMYYYATFYDYNDALNVGWEPADKFEFSGYAILQEDVDIWFYYLFD